MAGPPPETPPGPAAPSTGAAPAGADGMRAPASWGATARDPGEAASSRLEDILRAERSMLIVRSAGVVFAVGQVLAYRELPYPPGTKGTALGLAAALAVANLVIWGVYRRIRTLRGARTLAVGSLATDILVASGFVWVYAFDPLSALWAILYILPLEGAIRFQLAGALASWAVVTVLYAAREVWRVNAFPSSVEGPGGFGLQPESISFRMGIGLLIALVAGLMARNLTRERARLSSALAELSRIDALRARMVAALAHDVRNPLTTIRGTLKTLARHLDRLTPSVRRELVETADRQAGRLERLATELLDLARMEQGRLDLAIENVRLEEVVTRGLSFADHDRRFQVRIGEDVAVRADPARLEQIVVNLVSNALRYGKEPFVVEAEDAPDGRISLSIRDHGPGVPEEQRASLFEPFRTESDGSSVGLGLAIVKALAEAQGGEVSYEPNRPRGGCFRVALLSATGDG
ncbi:MAG TPA: ATP-binding protein [Actinomycetota bacterium]|nr:ATP-binding protein [Actinomycetota bacterium]